MVLALQSRVERDYRAGICAGSGQCMCTGRQGWLEQPLQPRATGRTPGAEQHLELLEAGRSWYRNVSSCAKVRWNCTFSKKKMQEKNIFSFFPHQIRFQFHFLEVSWFFQPFLLSITVLQRNLLMPKQPPFDKVLGSPQKYCRELTLHDGKLKQKITII